MLGDPPEIDEGSFVSRPPIAIPGNQRVKIGSPVYLYGGFDVVIDCRIVSGTRPITIEWFRNGSPHPTQGSVSAITITDAGNVDVFKCRADNIIGFDTESTTIYDIAGKWIMYIYIYIYIYMHAYVIHKTFI